MMSCQWLVVGAAVALQLMMVDAQDSSPPRILVFSRTLDYYHDSIPAAQEALRGMSSSFLSDFSEDPSAFSTSNLANYAAVAFLSNSEGLAESDPEVLDNDEQKNALFSWLGQGGALVGLHSGCACLFKTPEFGVAMGSWFDYHPTISNVTFLKVGSHPTTDMLPNRYDTFEEAYNFLTPPTGVGATVILTPDESSYADPEYASRGRYQGEPHPSAWYRDEAVSLANGSTTAGSNARTMTGRLWFTSLGHTIETWQSDVHRQHVQAGIEWALAGTSNSFVNATAAGSSSIAANAPTSSTSPGSSASTPSPSSAPTSSGKLSVSIGSIALYASVTLAAVAIYIQL